MAKKKKNEPPRKPEWLYPPPSCASPFYNGVKVGAAGVEVLGPDVAYHRSRGWALESFEKKEPEKKEAPKGAPKVETVAAAATTEKEG